MAYPEDSQAQNHSDAIVKKRFEDELRASGNLDEHEIRELSSYEFDAGPESVKQQIRRYYLFLRVADPIKADAMLQEIGYIHEHTLQEDDVRRICRKLLKYRVDGAIQYKGKSYTAE